MCDWKDNHREMEGLEEETADFVPEANKIRYGGAQGIQGEGDEDDEDAKKKMEERERKKAEVRKRLEEAGRAKKAKKGFLTPERKKKLRKLLMMKAAEDFKQQQLLKEQERQRILAERIIPLPDVDGINNQSQLEELARKFLEKIRDIEDKKYDLDYKVRQKDFEINELTIAVNDLRGKFVKPTLKKVSKYDNKFKKFANKGEEKVDFRSKLKVIKKADNVLEELMKKEKDKGSGPDWAKKNQAQDAAEVAAGGEEEEEEEEEEE